MGLFARGVERRRVGLNEVRDGWVCGRDVEVMKASERKRRMDWMFGKAKSGNDSSQFG